MTQQPTRLQQFQWCKAARDSLCLLDSLGILFNQKALDWCRARSQNLKASMSNGELEARTTKTANRLYKLMKETATSLVPDKKKLTLEDAQPAMRFCVFFAELMFMDAVNTCPIFASSPAWHEVKAWLREGAKLEESSPDEEPLKEEVLAFELYHTMNCKILGFPKKYGW